MKKPGLVKWTLYSVGLLVSLFPGFAFAGCYECQYSPSNWGFCRPAVGDGYGSCTTEVADPWNGTTRCVTGGICTTGGDEEGGKRGGPFNQY